MTTSTSITINDTGISVGMYYGPFNTLSEFNSYKLPQINDHRTFQWNEVENIRFGRWQRWWNILLNIIRPRYFWGGTNYVIIATTGGLFVVPVGPGSSAPWNFENDIIASLRKVGKDNLASPEKIKF